jgi:hypothetical protein
MFHSIPGAQHAKPVFLPLESITLLVEATIFDDERGWDERKRMSVIQLG